MRPKFIHILLTAASCGLLYGHPRLQAQTTLPDLPAPVITGKLGIKNSGALLALQAFIQTSGAATWRDLHADGQMIDPAGNSEPFDLWLRGGGYARLDVTSSNGVSSTRLTPCSGSLLTDKGITLTLPPATACAGFFAFPRLWRDAIRSAQISLRDFGDVLVNGERLHRLSMEYTGSSGGLAYGRQTTATDLYIDESSHLLVYSVDALAFPNTHGLLLKRITSYSSYKQYSGVSIPTSISQMLDGQFQWNMQIQNVQVNISPDSSYFRF